MRTWTLRMSTGLAAVLLAIGAGAPGAAAADDPGAIAARAFELRMAGQVDEAVAFLESGCGDHAQAGVLHYELARARLQLLDIGGMREAARGAVAAEPGNSEYRYLAAMAALYSLIEAAHHGDRDRMKELGREAMDQLETILATDPDYHEARFLLVQQSVETAPELGLEVGDTESHVTLLEEKDPILGAKARCCLVDENEQRKIWERILADDPEDCRALVEAAEGLIMIGDLDRAEACLDKAMQMDKESSYGLLGLGLAYFMRQDWDRAMVLTQRYLDTDPPVALKAYAVGRMGMIHLRRGDRDRARELMSEARALDPHVWQTTMPPPKEIFAPPGS